MKHQKQKHRRLGDSCHIESAEGGYINRMTRQTYGNTVFYQQQIPPSFMSAILRELKTRICERIPFAYT